MAPVVPTEGTELRKPMAMLQQTNRLTLAARAVPVAPGQAGIRPV